MPAAYPSPTLPRFLAGGGEAGEAIAAHDWSATPLGPIEAWPHALKTAVALVVRSPVAMALMWGCEGTLLYNDAYAALAGERHPAALGADPRRSWPEIADFIDGVIRKVLAGESLALCDQELHIDRHGRREPAWFSLGYSPVPGDVDMAADTPTDTPAGVLAVVIETTGRIASERAAAASEVRNRQILDSAIDFAIIAFDPGGMVTRWNEGAHRVLGWTEAEMLGRNTERIFTPEDRAAGRMHTEMHSALTVGVGSDERWHMRKSGERFWASGEMTPIHDADGAVSGFVKVLRDRTEQKLAQAALVASEAQFRSFAQATPNQVWTAPPDGTLDWFNDRVYEYSGRAPGELDGQGWTQIVHPDDLDAAAGRWAASLAAGSPYDTEFRIRRHDGAYRWHLVRAVPLQGADGAVHRWVGTNTDIDERKRAETESRRERNRIWALSQELMLVNDFDGRIVAVNPSATRLLGWHEDEMVGHGLADFVHPDDLAATRAEIAKLALGATTLGFENRYRAKDQSFRLLNWTAVPDGGLAHVVARDVTRERAAEDALRHSQKMEAVGRLTGGVAHDFNNLLTIIRTSIDLLRRPNLAEERRQRFMGSISNAVTRAAKLTGQLLAFARRQALQPVVFDAAQNVLSISDMIGTLVGARIEVEVRALEPACVVDADPSQFDTAIVNMAVNARDAMNGAGRLTIAVRRLAAIPALRSHAAVPGDCIAISLADSGTGIASDQLERIFEPFFTTKGVGLGTGLGLSQVFGFAKQSGGDIQVESTVGQGTTFTLYLPRAAQAVAERGAEAAAAAESATRPDGNGASILVVEDNPEVAASVDTTLRELGYTTVVARSADAALAELAADAKRFTLVFSDVVMTGMDGIALGHEIRRRHAGLPVVLSSGYSDVLATDDAHGFDLLPKPYSLDALAQVLQAAVTERPAGASARRPASIGTSADPLLAGVLNAEQQRLAELASMRVLDTEEEQAYDDLTRLAATLCDAPVALISLVDQDRQWFKSRIGTNAKETPRELAFCAHAIQDPDNVMVVGDASRDRRFAGNPLVTGEPNIRFYAGAPLVTSAGHALGTLCVIDTEARSIDTRQLELLQFLANQVVQRLEARRAALLGTAASGPGPRT